MIVESEWDPAKARSNLVKHGISFSDAEAVFDDLFAVSMPETGPHSEQRFAAIGADARGRIIVVVYTYRRYRLRIISARRASRSERDIYERRVRFQ